MEKQVWSTYGEQIRLMIFGASHAPEVGMILTGIPAGKNVDLEALQQFLLRRAPGRSAYTTARKEPDVPTFTSGVQDGVTDGNPIRAVIQNTSIRSADYEQFRTVPRPGHADYTASVKYRGKLDMAGGGPFSGRMTAPFCIAGGILKQLLAEEGIVVTARIYEIAGIRDTGSLEEDVAAKDFPVLDAEQGEKMKQAILAAKEAGDSLGGIVECAIFGLPVGLGGPLFEGMEGRIALAAFGIPGVKGIEFGAGFEAAAMRGSENNDAFAIREGTVCTKTNHAGGILGGITDGMPLLFRAAFKPTPSIAKPQESINLRTMKPEELVIQGRHDPCIVPRAVPCVEAAAAAAVYDAWLGRKKELAEMESVEWNGLR